MEGDALMEWTFVQDVMRNNKLLNALNDACPITLLSEEVLESITNRRPYSQSNKKADPASIFSCFTCGSPCDLCLAIVYPEEKTTTTHYLMSKEEKNVMEPGLSSDVSGLDILASVCDSFDSKQKDSSRKHVFCLEHAREVEQKLMSLGGVDMLLLCHPDYQMIEDAARLIGKELGTTYAMWTDIGYSDITEREIFTIHSALDDEQTATGNQDWAVKLGNNDIFNCAKPGGSSFYKKQMPYNYKTFLLKTGHY